MASCSESFQPGIFTLNVVSNLEQSSAENSGRAAGVGNFLLETGSMDYFKPAHQLYERFGFVKCGPFADYKLDPNSVFMTREL